MTASAGTEKEKTGFDPDEFRMSIGEHLEELRHRLILGIAGFAVAIAICLPMGKQILAIICEPLVGALQANDLNPQLFSDDTTEGFMAWIQVSAIAAVAVAGPWMVYQIWQFIASGLYPEERKYVTKYVPLAMVLLLTGVAFVYFIVLPLTMRFFVAFTASLPLDLPNHHARSGGPPPTTQATFVQAVDADPAKSLPYQMWFNTAERKIKINTGDAVRILPFGSDSLMAAHFKLGDYLDLVFRLVLTFGLCFQLPLVVLAVERLGIVDIPTLRSFRRYVYFGMTVLAAAVSPGDVITATLALLVPLILLYEFGILLAKMGGPRVPRAKREDSFL